MDGFIDATTDGLEGAEDGETGARVSSREALRFLTRVGRVLSMSLDIEQTLRRLVRLAVPRVACFAVIDLLRDDGRLERVAFGHVDPRSEPLLELPEPFLPEDSGLLPIRQVLDAGSALMFEQLERDWQGSRPMLERLQQIGGRSLIVVPLTAHKQPLGTLTLGSTRTDRFFRPTDLAMAREFARSAALALENARLYQQARQAIASRDEVLAVVSHDLRNPISRVRLVAEMLLETRQVVQPGQKSVEIILRATDEMTRLVADLLDIARIEAGTLSIEPVPCDLDELLERVEEAHADAARKKNLVWQVERSDCSATLLADRDRLLQALGNLVGNAIKFTPEGGIVRLQARVVDPCVRLGVRDTGPGMDASQLAHVFDRFWQGRSGDRRGAGLGLAITRGIVEAHGGKIWMESAPGRGTTAWIELPLQASGRA